MAETARDIMHRAWAKWMRNGNDDRDCVDAILEALAAKGYEVRAAEQRDSDRGGEREDG